MEYLTTQTLTDQEHANVLSRWMTEVTDKVHEIADEIVAHYHGDFDAARDGEDEAAYTFVSDDPSHQDINFVFKTIRTMSHEEEAHAWGLLFNEDLGSTRSFTGLMCNFVEIHLQERVKNRLAELEAQSARSSTRSASPSIFTTEAP